MGNKIELTFHTLCCNYISYLLLPLCSTSVKVAIKELNGLTEGTKSNKVKHFSIFGNVSIWKQLNNKSFVSSSTNKYLKYF